MYNIFFYYFLIFFVFSLLLKFSLSKQTKPISKIRSKSRLFNVIPYRELFGIPPISCFVLFIIKKFKNQKIDWIIIPESIGYMFITGIIIHGLFGIRSMLSYTLRLGPRPNGTGIAPYPNY